MAGVRLADGLCNRSRYSRAQFRSTLMCALSPATLTPEAERARLMPWDWDRRHEPPSRRREIAFVIIAAAVSALMYAAWFWPR